MSNLATVRRVSGHTREMSGVRSHAAFGALFAICIIAFSKSIWTLFIFSLHHEYSSHILLIPFISIFFLYIYKDKIFHKTRRCVAAGVPMIISGTAFFLIAKRLWSSSTGNNLVSAIALSLIIVWAGIFVLCYGYSAAREAAFPLLFLILMIPIPDVLLTRIIYALQVGSTEISFLLFKLTGTPVFRHGFFLAVPGYTIEVAQECSSIRSSVALFITCLIAAQMFLRNHLSRAVFVVLSIPLSIVKNGIRITTLTLLSIHVDPGFLTGRLHKEGGFVFFFAALALLWPVLIVLQKSEVSKIGAHTSPGRNSRRALREVEEESRRKG